jgi:CRP-like cAMP-binding protein
LADHLLIHREFLRTLPESLTRDLEARALLRRFGDGDVVFRRGDPAHGFFGVRSGRIQVLGRGARGREFVLTVLAPGEWFGELSLFDDLPRTHDNIALGDCELWFVPKRDFRALLQDHPEYYAHFAELLSHRVRMLFGFLEDAALLDLPARLAKRILELAGDHGEAGEGEDVALDLHLPQESLANMVGARREAVGRHLKRFEREGWIRLSYGRLVVCDRSGLASLL